MSTKETQNKRSEFKPGDRVLLNYAGSLQYGTVVNSADGLAVFFDGSLSYVQHVSDVGVVHSHDIFDLIQPMPESLPYELWSAGLFADDDSEPENSLDDLRHDIHRLQQSLSIRMMLMLECEQIVSDAAMLAAENAIRWCSPDGDGVGLSFAQVFTWLQSVREKLNYDPSQDNVPF